MRTRFPQKKSFPGCCSSCCLPGWSTWRRSMERTISMNAKENRQQLSDEVERRSLIPRDMTHLVHKGKVMIEKKTTKENNIEAEVKLEMSLRLGGMEMNETHETEKDGEEEVGGRERRKDDETKRRHGVLEKLERSDEKMESCSRKADGKMENEKSWWYDGKVSADHECFWKSNPRDELIHRENERRRGWQEQAIQWKNQEQGKKNPGHGWKLWKPNWSYQRRTCWWESVKHVIVDLSSSTNAKMLKTKLKNKCQKGQTKNSSQRLWAVMRRRKEEEKRDGLRVVKRRFHHRETKEKAGTSSSKSMMIFQHALNNMMSGSKDVCPAFNWGKFDHSKNKEETFTTPKKTWGQCARSKATDGTQLYWTKRGDMNKVKHGDTSWHIFVDLENSTTNTESEKCWTKGGERADLGEPTTHQVDECAFSRLKTCGSPHWEDARNNWETHDAN